MSITTRYSASFCLRVASRSDVSHSHVPCFKPLSNPSEIQYENLKFQYSSSLSISTDSCVSDSSISHLRGAYSQ